MLLLTMQRTLVVLPPSFSILQFPAGTPIKTKVFSLTATADEVSVVAEEPLSPEILGDGKLKCEPGWRALKLLGPIPFGETGVLHKLLLPLAAEQIGIFAVSTFDTDYILVKAYSLERAVSALRAAGYNVQI